MSFCAVNVLQSSELRAIYARPAELGIILQTRRSTKYSNNSSSVMLMLRFLSCTTFQGILLLLEGTNLCVCQQGTFGLSKLYDKSWIPVGNYAIGTFRVPSTCAGLNSCRSGLQSWLIRKGNSSGNSTESNSARVMSTWSKLKFRTKLE